jgi:TolB protein
MTWKSDVLTSVGAACVCACAISAGGGGDARGATAPPVPLVAYVTGSGDHIAVVGADGRGRHSLGPGWNPSWSPDGTKLAFAFGTTGSVSGVSVPDLAGGTYNVNIPDDFDVGRPRWSPDGRWVAFEAYPVQGSAGGDDVDYVDLWVAQADGTPPRLLVDATKTPGNGSGASQSGAAWSWSPDSQSIAFEWPAHRALNVAIVDVQTGAIRIVTHGGQPSWSPDGRHLVFVHAQWIDVIGVDGSGLRTLVRLPRNESGGPVSWSPDGKTIAYWTTTYASTESSSLMLIDAAGRSSPRLLFKARYEGSLEKPEWARDSHSLLVSNGNGVWLVPVGASSRPIRLAAHGQDADWRG